MSNMELILNMLAEATTTELSKKKNPQGFKASAEVAKQGGAIAGNTRKQIEKKPVFPSVPRSAVIIPLIVQLKKKNRPVKY